MEGKTMKKKTNIIVGICSCHGMVDKREAVRTTWLSHPADGIECVFFVGGNRAPEGEEGDTVGLDAADGYNELPGKVKSFFRHALEHYEFDWLFKCDDDTYLELGRLASLIDEDYDLIGDALVSLRNSPSGGAGYLLKRSMVEKLVDAPGFAECGAEDVIVGELVGKLGGRLKSTKRLYMSNVYYPEMDNDMVTAHWCSPSIMQAIYSFNYRLPSAVCDVAHLHWKGEMLFYSNGAFRRKDTSCYGWWSIGSKGELTLKWQMWPMEQLLLEGERYIGSETEICQRPAMPSLGRLWAERRLSSGNVEIMDQSPLLYIHLGCGTRRLNGWLNLDAPNYDITRPLPWKDGSVDAFYLEHVIGSVTPAQACRFFTEAFRSLKPGGVLRLSFRDVRLMRGMMTPAFRQYMKDRGKGNPVPGNDLCTFMEVYRQQSLWSADFLSYVLEELGFQVSQHAPGISRHLHLQCLERRADRDEHPFDLLGTVCLDAVKPEGAASSALLSMRRTSVPVSPDYVTTQFMPGSRTGNHLFQIAAAYAHALRTGVECRIPWRHGSETWELMTYLGEACTLCPDGGYTDPVTYREPAFSYRPIPHTVRRGALRGYFQSERYFNDVAEEVRSLFAPLISPVQEGYAGVHIRMGDYLDHADMYRTPDVPFLDEALRRLSNNIRKLVIFSDSPDLARKLMERVPEAKRFEIIMDTHETLDALRELTSMQELVLSCSSFSWWGGWLGGQQRVFIQKQWFAGKIEDEQDIFCPQWIKL